MRFKQVGNKSDLVGVVIKNNDTVTINAGQPVVLSMDGNGVDVVLPSTSAAIQLIWGLRYGVCLRNVAVGYYGEAQVFGFSYDVTIILATRANSSASWSTQPNLSIGQWLDIDTTNNYFSTLAYGITAGSTIAGSYTTQGTLAAVTITMLDPPAICGQTMSTLSVAGGTAVYSLTAGSASSTAVSQTAITASIQAFVRMM